MGDQTAIAWTERTWNPWQGCSKVSAGCKFCYMFRDKARYGQDATVVVRSAPQTFNAPLAQHGRGASKGVPGEWKWPDGQLVFTCSWSDWFHEDADAWRDDAWRIVRSRPGLTFQILTKRPERIAACLPADWGPNGYPNVWLGVSVEDQKAADVRLPLLARVPARVRFLSMEPLLGAVELGFGGMAPKDWHGTEHWTPVGSFFQWVIVGGESGTAETSRPCRAEWLHDVVQQCARAGVPAFVKQLGSRFIDDVNGVFGARCAATGSPHITHLRDGHGGDPAEWPPGLHVREFPVGVPWL